MSTSKIEWTDKTWNPVTGCTKVSQGCKHCYAETFYERFNGKGSFRNITYHPSRLLVPMRWKKPAMVFVNSMSDLFHESIPFWFIDQVFAVMALCPQHTFQVLTKRAARMKEYLDTGRLPFIQQAAGDITEDGDEKVAAFTDHIPNVWLGVSAEDQKTATERIPMLLQVPAAVHFVSCEPLLGPITFTINYETAEGNVEFHNLLTGYKFSHQRNFSQQGPKLDWVIVGGESGHGARPMYPDWVRSIRNQCEAEETDFFFKQWGAWSFGETGFMQRVGKHKSGRLLDGIEHQAFPLTQPI